MFFFFETSDAHVIKIDRLFAKNERTNERKGKKERKDGWMDGITFCTRAYWPHRKKKKPIQCLKCVSERKCEDGLPYTNPLITKTYLYNFDPLKPHFYIVKLGFTEVYIIFLISAQKHRLWVLVRTASPRRF